MCHLKIIHGFTFKVQALIRDAESSEAEHVTADQQFTGLNPVRCFGSTVKVSVGLGLNTL